MYLDLYTWNLHTTYIYGIRNCHQVVRDVTGNQPPISPSPTHMCSCSHHPPWPWGHSFICSIPYSPPPEHGSGLLHHRVGIWTWGRRRWVGQKQQRQCLQQPENRVPAARPWDEEEATQSKGEVQPSISKPGLG